MANDVTRVANGLRQAMSEMLELGYAQSRVSRSLLDADESIRESIERSLPPQTLSPGYYRRAEYLLWLEKYKAAGLTNDTLTLAEAEGLIALAEARREFERNHPPCGVCGALQESPFATSCCKCNTEFARRAA